MAVQSEIGLIDELVRLRAELRRREREAADKELQLQRYAADLRETFKQERARAQELRRSYMATVRALSNAVEARDAYTGKHAERVAAYGLEIARKFPKGYYDKLQSAFHDFFAGYTPEKLNTRQIYNLYDQWKKACAAGRMVDRMTEAWRNSVNVG